MCCDRVRKMRHRDKLAREADRSLLDAVRRKAHR